MPSKPVTTTHDLRSMGIDLVALETFIAVARSGSFSTAAAQLHVSQPTVSGRVQRLESALGTKLLVRTTRNVATTAQGAALLTEASAALLELQRIVFALHEERRLASRRVVVASTTMLAATRLPTILRDYRLRYTDVEVHLLDLPYAEALNAVGAGDADIAVLAFEGGDNRFREQALHSEEMVLVAPATHPLACLESITLAQLASWPLLVTPQCEPILARVAAEGKRSGVTVPASTVFSSLHTMIGMLDAGMGLTLLPRSIAREQKSAHARIEVVGPKLVRSYSIVRARKAKLGTAATSFIRFLRQAMAGDPP